MIKFIICDKNNTYQNQLNYYAKQLINPFKIEWVKFKNFTHNEQSLKKESEEILKKISPADFVILFDENGDNFTNQEMLKTITTKHNIVIIVGSAYGVDQQIKQRANLIWTLGKLIFPYELATLIICEQIYRCQMNYQNKNYSK